MIQSLNDIRTTFLNYFQSQGHTLVPSSPLVPRNDPTLLFTNSGMVQFKSLFTGLERRDYSRATTAQKCVRAGGKHNDLDNVGYTARHHTFFEMLGNFSFGDYFKADAIQFSWELVTRELAIPKDRLYVTVFHTDDEAAGLWKKIGGLCDDRIIRIPTDDNFWMMGPTGPCGPCSEIFYDHGDHIWGGPPGSPDQDGDRFVEIWNLVFMQYEQFEDGRRDELPRPSIDTGMGIERIGALLQGSNDNYATDTLRALIEASANLTSTDPDGPCCTHHRVIADHLRSSAFLIADGVMPSNDGRGYVLRRIMRRALRHLHLLGTKDPVFCDLLPTLNAKMGSAYPELVQAEALIVETLRQEELRFKKMLDRGLKLLDQEVARLKENQILPGKTAFSLYDTYGFPLDLTQDALREKGISVDVAAFDEEMADQRRKARAAWKGSGEVACSEIWFDIVSRQGATEFLGYEQEQIDAQITALVQAGEGCERTSEGAKLQLVTNQTVFYAESGGQVGDTGAIQTKNGIIEVTDTQRIAGLIVHHGRVISGEVRVGDAATLQIDSNRRALIRSNHSATHLLHEALRQILGSHVFQRGSLNARERLRFDFSHGQALSLAEMRSIEREVNSIIRQNSLVETRIMTPEDAQAIGAQALFGEKYGDEVRIVAIGYAENSKKGFKGNTYSLELCGGTHVQRTGDIGTFVLQSDGASSAGVRRIEALTGAAALDYLRTRDHLLNDAALMFKASVDVLPARIQALLSERKKLQNELGNLRRNAAGAGGGGLQLETKKIGDIVFVYGVLTGVTGKDLPDIIDKQKSATKNGVIFLIADNQEKAAAAIGITKELSKKFSAKDLIGPAVAALGGRGGGGRADLAQGGAPSAAGADKAISAVECLLRR